jgi:AcrR family transcriptional regulator
MAQTVELHTTVGPAHTTLLAIAKRAGIERPTLYRHFPTVLRAASLSIPRSSRARRETLSVVGMANSGNGPATV